MYDTETEIYKPYSKGLTVSHNTVKMFSSQLLPSNKHVTFSIWSISLGQRAFCSQNSLSNE